MNIIILILCILIILVILTIYIKKINLSSSIKNKLKLKDMMYTINLFNENNHKHMIENHKKDINKSNLEHMIENINLYNNINQCGYNLDYPMFYINMEKNTRRRKYMESQLEKISKKYYRVNAFNGYEIKNKEHDIVDNTEFINSYKKLSKPEIGCTVSHILAIKTAYQQGFEIVMICEDDIFLGTSSLIPKLSYVVKQAPEDWDIIKLYSGFGEYVDEYNNYYKQNPKSHIFVKRQYPKVFWGTLCYLINKNAMKKILEKVYKNTNIIHIQPIVVNSKGKYPISGTSDVFLYDIVDNCYSVVPNLFTPNNTNLDSTIHKDHTDDHIDQSLVRINFFNNIIQNIVKDQLNIYCFWTGDNRMPTNREKSLEQLREKTNGYIILITPKNLKNYILNEHPLHPGYQYLSDIHKADYLRTYFMHFYGGGYSDIKKTRGNWVNSYLELINNPDRWICGYQEIEGGVAYPPLKDNYKDLVGNCAYICKPNTPLTTDWYNEMIKLLDNKYTSLKENPAKSNYDCSPSKSGYPIEWNELLGRIFHKVSYNYKDKILQTLPQPIFENYR